MFNTLAPFRAGMSAVITKKGVTYAEIVKYCDMWVKNHEWLDTLDSDKHEEFFNIVEFTYAKIAEATLGMGLNNLGD